MTDTKNTVSDERLADLIEAFKPQSERFGEGSPEYNLVLALTHYQSLRASVPGGVGVKGLEIAAHNLIASRFDTYKARNGRTMSIESDDGEKCWIVHFDEMHELECALSALDLSPAEGGAVIEQIATAIDAAWRGKGGLSCTEVCAIVRTYATPPQPVATDAMVERFMVSFWGDSRQFVDEGAVQSALTAALSVKPAP